MIAPGRTVRLVRPWKRKRTPPEKMRNARLVPGARIGAPWHGAPMQRANGRSRSAKVAAVADGQLGRLGEPGAGKDAPEVADL
jgi:hypothetical protein